MSQIDLIFEGGGAKGMVFGGALQVLFNEAGHTHGRLLGTSAGAIMVVGLAAGYTPDEIMLALQEQTSAGEPIFQTFLGMPAPFDDDAVSQSTIHQALEELDLPLVPDWIEGRLDDWIARQLASRPSFRHLFSLVERGGWYSADPFLDWLRQRLDEPKPDGTPRGYSGMTLREFFEVTGVEMTLVAADTTWQRMLLLNHNTAPGVPVVWAARMSMSFPLFWQEVEWDPDWGFYYTFEKSFGQLLPNNLAGHTIVDGGLLSNFPIALFLADHPDVEVVVGPARVKNVLGLLIDEAIEVPNCPPRPPSARPVDVGALGLVRRLNSLLNTATKAADNTAIAAFPNHVVRLPARGYGTMQFDMTDGEREALVEAGRVAMRTFLASQTVLEGMLESGVPAFAPGAAESALANQAAALLLER
jgi:predicted acylesterase/phospholipase RssA